MQQCMDMTPMEVYMQQASLRDINYPSTVEIGAGTQAQGQETVHANGEFQPNGQRKEESKDEVEKNGGRGGKGYSFKLTAFFLVAQMVGGGFLSLSSAIAGTGWIGMVFLVVFCLSVCFSGIRLGRCWVILEERWPKYIIPSRQPYMDISERAIGLWARRVTLFCIMFTLFGATTVFLIIASQLISDLIPMMSQCQWVLILALFLTPFTWLGTPKDFWQTSVIAVLATLIAAIVIIVKIILDYSKIVAIDPPHYAAPTISSFAASFGTILFAFGGAAVFPTIQNDMKDRSKFGHGAILAFVLILCMYAPVASVGYYYFGSDVQPNILLSMQSSIPLTVAMALQIINLIGTYIIAISPITQGIEDMLHVPSAFTWKRIVIRSSIVIFEVIIALAIPNFGLILSLVGGSTITILSFVFPPLCYMKLVDDKSEKSWPERNIPKWERIYLWIIISVGVIGGLSSTVNGIIAIISPDSFGNSCFVMFGPQINETLLIEIELLSK